MLLGAVAALIAWGVAFLILKRGTSSTNIAMAAVAGLVVAIGLSWVAAIAMLGAGAIPVGGIAGAVIGVVAAVVAAKRKPA
jgi:hypothetical protein